MKTFTLTEDHLKLLQRANIRWEDCEYGAPAIDCKRPYGNSFVAGDIAELLGWQFDEELTTEQKIRAKEIHHETETALQIILITRSFQLGEYEQTDKYDYCSWRFVG